MSALLASAPTLDARRIDQIAALPLGGRVKLDPRGRSGRTGKGSPRDLGTGREKMPFEITPFFPYLTRLPGEGSDKVALGSSPSK
jgi:hypothetical protein